MANGKPDIKLTDDFDGQVKVEAPDFCVDGGSGRRMGNTQNPFRRAFVHDGGDGLTVNWANDYTGGVTLNGVKTIGGHGVGTRATEFTDRVDFKGDVDCYSKIRFVAAGWSSDIYTDPNHNLVIENKPFLGMPPRHAIFNTPVDFKGPVQVKKKTTGVFLVLPGSEENPYYWDLDDALSKLSERVAALEKKSTQEGRFGSV
jgi:hypothetical protein